MRKRVYHRFPLHDAEFVQNYSFWAGLPYLVKTLAGLWNKSGSFKIPDINGRIVTAKRTIATDITHGNIDFEPLKNDNLDMILDGIKHDGTLDFRIRLLYSYLDKDYDRVPTRGDTFLVRSILKNGILNLKIHQVEGPAYTTCKEIANTIVDELSRGQPD